jgi:RNA polymerase sigma-70 factor (ECF subfamily)
MNTEEIQLIEKARTGDMAAFEKLVYRYDKHVLAIAASFRNNKEDAKDIYQEVFLRVYRGLKNFEGKSEFSTWLFRITTNVCITYSTLKKKHAYTPIDNGYEDEEGESSSIIDKIADDYHTDRDLLNGEMSKGIDRAIETLSPQQKMVFVLKHVHDHKIKEIAEMMNCTEGTVKRYLFTAVQKLRDKLKSYNEN